MDFFVSGELLWCSWIPLISTDGRCSRLVNCFYIGSKVTFKSTITCRPERIGLLSDYTVLYLNNSNFSVKTIKCCYFLRYLMVTVM